MLERCGVLSLLLLVPGLPMQAVFQFPAASDCSGWAPVKEEMVDRLAISCGVQIWEVFISTGF